MSYKKIEIKNGITIHELKTDKFKTNLFTVFLSMPLDRNEVTKNALIAAVLRRGSMSMSSQEIISENLEEMYGALFNCGIEKVGDTHILKFYLENINDEFLPNDESILKKSIDILLEIVFNPLVENGGFKKEYVEGEKNNLKQIIESKIDNKALYSLERATEEMFKDEPYGLCKFGYIEDLENINEKNLYEYYLELIRKCKIDVFASGDINDSIVELIQENQYINNLSERTINICDNKEKKELKEVKKIIDKMDVTQGKLVIGLDVMEKDDDRYAIAMLYNAILGGGANSKLFQNVREKNGLAYTCGSSYTRRKQIIFIRAGIEIKNYEKALKLIKEQLEDIKNGKFSDEDLENAKNLILATIDSITEEQDSEVTYYFSGELSKKIEELEEYKNKIRNVRKDDILNIAEKIRINTIYFLTTSKEDK